jgi:ferritin-like metal-binding protein YciE
MNRNGTLHQGHHDNEHLFIHQLQDIYYAEKQLVKALPKMAEGRVNLRAAS